MKLSSQKNNITFFFLIFFLSLKMVGLHALSHADDEDYAIHCAVCDTAIANKLTPAITPDLPSFVIENTELPIEQELVVNYNFVFSNTIASNQLFSRPPPYLLQ